MKFPVAIVVMVLMVLPACEPSVDHQLMVGQLESDRIELTAEFSEPIVARLVAEGDRVSAGTVLIEQNNARANAKVRQSEATVAQSKARLDELTRGPRKEQIVAAQANVDGSVQELAFRQTELERIEKLLDRKLSSPGDRDRAAAALDAATASLHFNKAKLAELLTGTTLEELQQARAAVSQVEAQLELARIDLERLSIVAPADGVVDSFLFDPGERPGNGQPVVIMLAGQQPYARIYVTAELRASVAPGDRVRVLVEGIQEPFEGRFRWIAKEAAFTPYFALTEHDRGRLTYLAKIDIVVDGDRLPEGLPVEVFLLTPGGATQ